MFPLFCLLCYNNPSESIHSLWRRTEVAVTGLTRNQFIGLMPVRGFESLRLRKKIPYPKKYFH